MVIFCLGGAGISADVDDPDSSSSSDSDSIACFPLAVLDLGWAVLKRFNDEGRVSVSVALSFPFPFLDVDGLD
jgi:hypothetical protein